MSVRVMVSLACLVWLVGCGGDEGGPSSTQHFVVDAVGTKVVVRNLWDSPDDLPHFRLRELWRVGGVSVDEEAQFSGPFFTASFAPNGDAVFLDMARAEVSVFAGGSGVPLQILGGAGQGPGELSSPGGLAWDGLGRLWVANAFNGRYTIFDPDGTFLRTVPRPSRRVNGLQFSLVYTPSGDLADHRSADPRLILLQVDSTGGVVDSLVIRQPERDPLQGGPLLPGSALREVTWLRPSLRWAFDADGSSVWALRSDSLRLVQVDWTGDTLRKVTTAHRSPSFSPVQREAIRKAGAVPLSWTGEH